MPETTKEEESRAVTEPQRSPSSAVLWLETLSGVPGPGAGYVLCNRFRDRWRPLKQMIESDLIRIRAHSTANYDEPTKQQLKIAADDAEDPLRKADVLAELFDTLLVAVEDALDHAREAAQEADQKMKEEQESKRSQ